MAKLITVTISTKVITADGLSSEDAEAFEHLVPSGKLEVVTARHDTSGLLPKEAKELAAFCEFARRPEFHPAIQRLLGARPGNVLQLESLSSGEDPPDLRLKLGRNALPIEITDFPPDQEAMAQAIAAVKAASPLPAFHEGGCSPELIEKFMLAGESLTKPHFASLDDEAYALAMCADNVLRDKDKTGKSQLLLLYGPLAFGYPADEVLKLLVSGRAFAALRAVVFLTPSRANVYWTNLA